MHCFPELSSSSSTSSTWAAILGACQPRLCDLTAIEDDQRSSDFPMHQATAHSTTMKVEHDYGGSHHTNDYGGQWVHVTDDQPPHQSPLHDFNNFYMTPPQLHLESIYPRPATSSQTSNPPLYPLVVPQWPSQLTNPSLSPPTSQPLSSSSAPVLTPRPILPLSTPVDNIPAPLSAPAAPTPIPIPQSGRRTLTDQDRRRMCQYHEENPSVKQTEIGCEFAGLSGHDPTLLTAA